jgi:phage tail protein X
MSVANDGDRFDKIIYKHYKDLSVLENVMQFNSHLLGKLILSAGDKVYLPPINKKIKVNFGKALW